ncbi:hypothetical protein BC941DRAFT_429759 [Chlamydoabsidia padenii]|nr:hypothetical protein BC941DRAFT_429759 [Chlamydoabsidia padenii]
MSKKQHDFYYSFTSPPSITSETPSAPPFDQVVPDDASTCSPPDYDEAIRSLDPDMPSSAPPANKSELTGYIRDESIPCFNPAASSSNTTNSKPTHDTGDYDGFDDHGIDDDDQGPLLQEHQWPVQEHNSPPTYSVYHAKYQVNQSGVLSRDHHLNNDGEALAQFLQQHNIPPRLKIKFYGYHDETHYRTRKTHDKDGHWQEERQPVTKRVDDFNFTIDCSDSVSTECQGLYVLPDPKSGCIKTVRQLCDDYVRETNQLKELQLTKVIDWDYARLTRAFTAAIRAHGYHHSICISYELTRQTITIKTDSLVSQMSDNWMVRGFFYLTFLWIFTWPALWLCRKKFGHSTLKSEWVMAVSERQWYNDHVHEVLGQIKTTPSTLSDSTGLNIGIYLC